MRRHLPFSLPGAIALAILLATSLATSATAGIIQQLDFTQDGVLPSVQPDIVFHNNTGSAEAALYSVSTGQLHQQTIGVNGNASYLSPNASLTGGPFDAARTTSMVVRVRVLSIGSGATQIAGGAYFEFFNGAHSHTVAFQPGGLQVPQASGPPAFVPLDITSFHTYQLVSPGNSAVVRLFVDGLLVFSGMAPASTLNGFDFGDGMSEHGAGAEADWDLVRIAQDDGAPAQPLSQEWEPVPPLLRAGMSTVYDSFRDRLIMFGGDDGASSRSDIWAFSLSGSPKWTKLRASGTAPSARVQQAMIYDPVRDRLVIFGGIDAGGYSNLPNGTWALSLSDTPSWSQLAPSGSLPEGRYAPTAVYDPVKDEMVVFGGANVSHGNLNEVWALSLQSPNAWRQLAPSGTPPPGMVYHTSVYDSLRHRMVTCGFAYGGTGTWALTLGDAPTWTQIAAPGTGPGPLNAHVGVFDPHSDRLVIFGGGNGSVLNDTWALSLSGPATWTLLAPTGPLPAGRVDQAAIYDPVRSRLMVFGGTNGTPFNQPTKSYYSDVWALSLGGALAWSQSYPDGPQPTPRIDGTMVYDPGADRLLAFGGDGTLGGGTPSNQTWSYPLTGGTAWTLLSTSGTPPAARSGHTAVLDVAGRRMIVMGGAATGPVTDVWSLDLSGSPTWSSVAPSGTAPAPRFAHAAIYDAGRRRMVVFGGTNGISQFNDTWALDFSGAPAWQLLSPTGSAPPPLSVHTAVFDAVGDRMIVFGGYSGSAGGALDRVWQLAFSPSLHWSELTPAGTPPSGRTGHGAIFDPMARSMIVFGGTDQTRSLNDIWSLNLSDTPAWTAITPQGGSPPVGRHDFASTFDPVRRRLLVHAGYSTVTQKALQDTWALGIDQASSSDASIPTFLLSNGTTGSGAGQFRSPVGVAVAPSGDVYATDLGNHRIQRFTRCGAFVTQWGSSGTGDGQFQGPANIAVDGAGNVFVTDNSNHRVQKFDPSGTFLTKWGSVGEGDGQFLSPTGIAVDAIGNVYVADNGTNRIQVFSGNGAFLRAWGSYGSGDGQLANPQGVGVDSHGDVYVSDWNNHRVQKFSGTGVFIAKWGTQGAGDGQFQYPGGLAVDARGIVYVGEHDRIQKFSSEGAFLAKWAGPGSAVGQLKGSCMLAVDAAGDVYAADLGNDRVQRFTYAPPTAIDIVDPGADTFWLTGSSSAGRVTWTPPSPCVTRVDLEYSFTTSARARVWRRLATDVDASAGAWEGVPLDPMSAADTSGAQVRLTAKTSSGGRFGEPSISADFAVGNVNAIRLDVQRNDVSQFSPPVLYWNEVPGAEYYVLNLDPDGRSSCVAAHWGPVRVNAPRRWRLLEPSFWTIMPASKYVVSVQAFSASGSPIGGPHEMRFTRFKLSDLTPGATGAPVLLVHGWVADQSNWYNCFGTSPLVEGLVHGAGGENFHPWAIEYPNIGHIARAAAGLSAAVDYLRQDPNPPSVRLVAHSMGGLVSRAYLEGFAEDPNSGLRLPAAPSGAISHLVTLATPHLGEPEDAVQGGQAGHQYGGSCPADLDSDAGFDLRENSTIVTNLNTMGTLPPIHYFFAGGVDSKYEAGGSARKVLASLIEACGGPNDAAVDICSSRGDCQNKHGRRLAAFEQGATIRHGQYLLSHNRMSHPGESVLKCKDGRATSTYDRKHADDSTRLLGDVLDFLRGGSYSDNPSCPSGLKSVVRYRVNDLSTLAVASGPQRGSSAQHPTSALDTATPIAGARITIRSLEDPEGEVAFVGTTASDGGMGVELGEGDYEVRLEALGFVARSETLYVGSTTTTATHSLNLTRDLAYVGPRDPRLALAGGGTVVADSVISLSLGCLDATQMMVGDSVDFAGAVWQPLSTPLSFTLHGGPGFHSLWAKFRDGTGRESDVVEALIEYLNAGAGSVQVDASGGIGEVWVDGFPTGQNTPAVVTPVGQGFHRVAVIATNRSCEPASAVVLVDSAGVASAHFDLIASSPPSDPSWAELLNGAALASAAVLSWRRSIDADPGPVVYDLAFFSDSALIDRIWTVTGRAETTLTVPASLPDSSTCFASLFAIDAQQTPQSGPTARLRFRVDRTAPSGVVVFPAKGSAVPGRAAPLLRFAVHDWSGPTHAVVTLSLDGGASYPDTLYAGAYADSLAWASPAVRSEQCRLRLLVTDAAGNAATIDSDSLFALYGDLVDVGGTSLPNRLTLRIHPVPARGSTKVMFELPSASTVRLEAFDVAGRSVRLLAAGRYAAGAHELPWDLRRGDGTRLSTGVYFVRMRTDEGNRLSRVVVVQ